MTTKKPAFCPSCGAEGSMEKVGPLYVCNSSGCGRAIPVYPKSGPTGPPKKAPSKKSK